MRFINGNSFKFTIAAINNMYLLFISGLLPTVFKFLTARNKTQVQLILSAFTYTLHIHLILHTVHYNCVYIKTLFIPSRLQYLL